MSEVYQTYGEVPPHTEGATFDTRQELHAAGLHRPLQAGIAGRPQVGAESIVLSGGYEDDEDYGDTIIYTGQGGRDPETGQQVAPQELTRGNQALALNCLNKLPVRVIRGARHKSPFSPAFGYRYDGLYMVEDYWHEIGRSGYPVWRFRLVKMDAAPTLPPMLTEESVPYLPAEQGETIVSRLLRDAELARHVKQLYDYACQVCGTRLHCSPGPYAEAAHIRPLGAPHNGPDTLDNMLCLCPNHHVLLDHGGLSIADDFSLIGAPGYLTVHPTHNINKAHLHYHREHYTLGS